MKLIKITCLFVFTVIVLGQGCSDTSYNQPCSTASGNGVCCSCNGYPLCVIDQQQCCGNCGSCKSSQKCCSRGQFYSEGYCLSGSAQCCLQGTDKAYPCPAGSFCCENGLCCKNTLTIWALILIIVGGLFVVGAIIFFVLKKIKSKKELQNYRNMSQ